MIATFIALSSGFGLALASSSLNLLLEAIDMNEAGNAFIVAVPANADNAHSAPAVAVPFPSFYAELLALDLAAAIRDIASVAPAPAVAPGDAPSDGPTDAPSDAPAEAPVAAAVTPDVVDLSVTPDVVDLSVTPDVVDLTSNGSHRFPVSRKRKAEEPTNTAFPAADALAVDVDGINRNGWQLGFEFTADDVRMLEAEMTREKREQSAAERERMRLFEGTA